MESVVIEDLWFWFQRFSFTFWRWARFCMPLNTLTPMCLVYSALQADILKFQRQLSWSMSIWSSETLIHVPLGDSIKGIKISWPPFLGEGEIPSCHLHHTHCARKIKSYLCLEDLVPFSSNIGESSCGVRIQNLVSDMSMDSPKITLDPYPYFSFSTVKMWIW